MYKKGMVLKKYKSRVEKAQIGLYNNFTNSYIFWYRKMSVTK